MSKLAIIYTEEQWKNSPLSIVRHYGRTSINNINYVIVNKEGKDIFQLSVEAQKEDRTFAIPPGEPCDLIDTRYIHAYKHFGRDSFINMVANGYDLEKFNQTIKNEKKKQ